eukprot:COSAG01_NODE_6056_length_3876_cov_9.951019_4_plen_142_part_00
MLWLTRVRRRSGEMLEQVAVVVVFIASEESTKIQDVGVDMLVKEGKLEHLKNGPVFWCDSADSQPCIGTAAAIQWTIKANGYLFHSGLPHKGINGAHAPAVLWCARRTAASSVSVSPDPRRAGGGAGAGVTSARARIGGGG